MNRSSSRSVRRGPIFAVLVALTLVLGLSAPVLAQEGTPRAGMLFPVVQPGEFTEERPYLVAENPDTLEITPILTSGEVVRGSGYQMAAAPDGLGAYQDGDDAVVFMSHELRAEDGEHISDARVSRLVLDGETAAVRSGEYPVNGSEGYQSLSSAFLAGPDVGFDEPVFFTGEEGTGGEHGGIVVSVDVEGSAVTELPWFGRFPHESAVVVPEFEDQTVLFLTDGDRMGSEAYLYVADTPQDVLEGNGQLYVFVADNAGGTADIAKGDTLSGRFEPIDEQESEDARALQTAAEAADAFQFVRLGDATYDRTETNTIYFTDTGDNADPNIAVASGDPLSANGRLYSMTLDPSDPTRVTSLRVLLDGDTGDDIRNPDGIAANTSSIMIQEDLNEDNRETDAENTGRILAYDIAAGGVTLLARIDQSDDQDRLVDEDDEAGLWASSGIVDVSDLFGPGTWLVTVQAHTLEVPQFDGVDEGGQLLLLRQLTPEAAPTTEATVAPVPTAGPVVAPTATTETVAPTTERPMEPTAKPTIAATATVEPTVELTEEDTPDEVDIPTEEDAEEAAEEATEAAEEAAEDAEEAAEEATEAAEEAAEDAEREAPRR